MQLCTTPQTTVSQMTTEMNQLTSIMSQQRLLGTGLPNDSQILFMFQGGCSL